MPFEAESPFLDAEALGLTREHPDTWQQQFEADPLSELEADDLEHTDSEDADLETAWAEDEWEAADTDFENADGLELADPFGPADEAEVGFPGGRHILLPTPTLRREAPLEMSHEAEDDFKAPEVEEERRRGKFSLSKLKTGPLVRPRTPAVQTVSEAEAELDELSETETEFDSESAGEFSIQELPPPTPEAMPVPRSRPLPMARVAADKSFWPVRNGRREVNYVGVDGSFHGSRKEARFLAKRSGGRRYHCGVDLPATAGDAVVACEDGTILAFYPFCCGRVKTSWALLVQHPNAVVNYGAVAPDSLAKTGLTKGSKVRAGQVIAYVGRSPKGSSTLHLETYVSGTQGHRVWVVGQTPPAELLNPSQYLLTLSRSTQRVPSQELHSLESRPTESEGGVIAYYPEAHEIEGERAFLDESDEELE